MSVILTGMDMPNMCGRCKLWDIDRKICTRLVQTNEDKMTRRNDCPVKSVDGLIEKMEKFGGHEKKSVYKNLNPSYVQGLKDAIKMVKEYCEQE